MINMLGTLIKVCKQMHARIDGGYKREMATPRKNQKQCWKSNTSEHK